MIALCSGRNAAREAPSSAVVPSHSEILCTLGLIRRLVLQNVIGIQFHRRGTRIEISFRPESQKF
jgi:hypothetical protein